MGDRWQLVRLGYLIDVSCQWLKEIWILLLHRYRQGSGGHWSSQWRKIGDLEAGQERWPPSVAGLFTSWFGAGRCAFLYRICKLPVIPANIWLFGGSVWSLSWVWWTVMAWAGARSEVWMTVTSHSLCEVCDLCSKLVQFWGLCVHIGHWGRNCNFDNSVGKLY